MNETPKKAKKRINWGLFKRFLDKDKTPSPLLLLTSMLLILSFKLATGIFPDKTGGYLGCLILQLIIFFIPAYLYSKFTSRGKLSLHGKDFRLKAPSIDYTFLLLSCAMFLCALLFLVDMIFKFKRGYPDGFYLYNTFFTGKIQEPDTFVYPILTFALTPAVCEEFVFRGVIHRSYEKNGYLSASIISSILYALVMFDLTLIPSALILGMLMSFILYITDSIVACIIVNFIYKLFMLFLGTNMGNYLLTGGNNLLLYITVIAFLLVSLCIFSFECSRIFKQRAKENMPTPTLCEGGKSAILHNVSSALFTMCIVICAFIYVAFNVINIFL